MKASSIPPKTLIASSMIQQRLLPEAGGAGVEERGAGLADGKFKCGHAFKSHILTKKSTKRKRNLRSTNHVRAEDAGRVARMLPYA